MANVVRPHDENDLLRYIGRMVRDAFEILGHPNHPQAGQHPLWVCAHMRDHRIIDGLAMLVDGVVAAKDTARDVVVPPYERVECVMKHFQRSDGHRREFISAELARRVARLHGPLADIDGLIADTFEIRDEPQCGSQKAQIVGNGLP